MLKIVCVNAGNYLGRGKEYVKILADMVTRNLPVGTAYEFLCFTDDPEDYGMGIKKMPVHEGLNGWWNKLCLFKAGTFAPDDRVVFFDLDTVIVGDLTDIIAYGGEFATLRDFYSLAGYGSSVMLWRGGFGEHIWDNWIAAGKPEPFRGDQEWIFEQYKDAEILQDIFPDKFRSYKVECEGGFPANTAVVCFHGVPRPHEVGGWVKDFWKIGGKITLDGVVGNTEEKQLVKNILHSTKLCRTWVQQQLEHDGHAVIVGGGPSLRSNVADIKKRADEGQTIFALNNSWDYLIERGIRANAHIMLDARPDNAKFVPPPSLRCIKFYASQCAKEVWDIAPDARLWNHLNARNLVEDDPRANTYLAGGSTVGLNAMSLAYILGYRKIHLYGFDSSYDDDQHHHAYTQPLNDKERVIQVTACGKEFTCAAWMAQQTNEFRILVPQLVDFGCEITVHGEGLLPHVARNMSSTSSNGRE